MEKPKCVYVTLIATTPPRLWRALTRADSIRKFWFDRHNESRWTKGAAIESRSPKGELEWRGRVLESKPRRRLVHSFEVICEKEAPSRVSFELEPLRNSRSGPKGRAVRLTLTHDRFPARSKVYPGVVQGWPAILSSLKTLLETGRSLRLTWKN